MEDVTTAQLAEVLGLTIQRIGQLRKEGVLDGGDGRRPRFDLAKSVQAYVRFCVDSARGRTPDDAGAEKRKLQAEADYKQAKARQEEIKLAELEGRMHSAEDVEAATTELVYAVRSMLLAMPGRVAVDAAGKTAAEVSDVVGAEARAILESLAGFRYDPAKYAAMVREREGWVPEDDED